MNAPAAKKRRYRCACGHELQVFGCGRHRRYFGPLDVALIAPVITRVCPVCRQTLPGKNPF